MSTLVIAEHAAGRVGVTTLETITAAVELGEPVTLAVVASESPPGGLAREGVDEVIHVRVPQQEFESDVYREAVYQVAMDRQPNVVLAGFTVNAMGWAPALATRMRAGFASDVFALSGQAGHLSATRAFYGGKVHADLAFPEGRPVVLLLRPATWRPAPPSGPTSVTTIDGPEVESRARHVEFLEPSQDDDVDISDAPFVLAIGRGVGEKENLQQFEELAHKLGATLAVSRPLVDAGWMPSSRQVGQSGKTVKPKVYLAFGISGAIQHLAGMKSSETIIAVNTDPEAAIFGVANYGAVADIFDVAEEIDRLA